MTNVVALSAAALLVVGAVACSSGSSDVVARWQCSVVDGQGKSYLETDFQAVAAMSTAQADCAEDALDPASCVAQGCEPASCLGEGCGPSH